MDKGDEKLIADIEEFGWHVLHVLEDDSGPRFSYSIGLFKTFGHPEIILIGLKHELAHTLIDNFGHDIESGRKYQSGQFYSDILDDFRCLMIDVKKEHYHEHFGYAKWYYKSDNFPALQCIYPTVEGVYPWENEWPADIKYLQPILGDIGERG